MAITPTNLNPADVEIPTNGSFLSFTPSQSFREALILLNLKPYLIDGINSEDQGTITYQQTLPDLSSPEVLFSFGGFPPIFRNDNPGEKIIPSTYTAYNILTSTNVQGTPGSISEDSYLAKIGAQVLKGALLETNATYLESDISDQNSVSFKITTPNVNDTFESKLDGSYQPTSPIPGDYFLDGLNKRTTNTLGEAINLIAGRAYPMRIVYGEDEGTNFRGDRMWLKFTEPDGIREQTAGLNYYYGGSVLWQSLNGSL
jgi:hypothetical protein